MPRISKSTWDSEPPENRRLYRTVIIGGLVLIGFCALSILVTRAGDRWYRSRMVPRVERAVHATFPDLCNAPEDKLLIGPSGSPRSLVVYRYWDVSCAAEPWMTGPAMIVDVHSCTVYAPKFPTTAWHETFQPMFHDGQRLTVCP